MAQKELAESLGIPKENIMMLHTGDVLEIGEESAQVIDHVQSGGVLVDGLGAVSYTHLAYISFPQMM